MFTPLSRSLDWRLVVAGKRFLPGPHTQKAKACWLRPPQPYPLFDQKLPVPRIELLIILVLAIVGGAVTAHMTGHFEPLPLLAGVIGVGAYRSWRLARQRG